MPRKRARGEEEEQSMRLHVQFEKKSSLVLLSLPQRLVRCSQNQLIYLDVFSASKKILKNSQMVTKELFELNRNNLLFGLPLKMMEILTCAFKDCGEICDEKILRVHQKNYIQGG